MIASILRARDAARYVMRGLQFLDAVQEEASSDYAGAWPSSMHEATDVRTDWNCFTACWVYESLGPVARSRQCPPIARARARDLRRRALAFILTCRADAPEGAFRFWRQADRPAPGPDLDDTALAHLALLDAGHPAAFGPDDAVRLFGPYRTTRGCALHPASRWAQVYPGVFTVWVDDGPGIVDACATANVVRCLCRGGACDVPGYRVSVAMLADLVAGRLRVTRPAPYYRSRVALTWFCALIRPPAGARLPEERALDAALDVTARVGAGRAWTSVLDAALQASVALVRGHPPDPVSMEMLLDCQAPDGGWPEGEICCDLYGTPYWTSRAVTTALVLRVLAQDPGTTGALP